MLVRSITQLPENNKTSSFLSGCMEMSLPLSGSLYVSTKVRYADMLENIKNVTTSAIVNEYKLNTGDDPIDIADIQAKLNDIAYNKFTLNGIKEFTNWPYISVDFPSPTNVDQYQYEMYGNDYEYAFPNVKKVKQLINDSSMFMSTTNSMVAEGNPLPLHGSASTNANVPEALDYQATIGSNKFYFWQINDGQSDSSIVLQNQNTGSTGLYQEMRDTGNLVMWGWLADYGTPPPEPQFCWVALYASIKTEGSNDTHVDIPIAVQPWIRGQHAAAMQYVGFNVPVKKGLRLKVKTGFPVNGKTSGFQGQGSLTFLDQWIPNAFFGYVIK